MTAPRKLILRNFQSPGDLVMMLFAITSLHRSHPKRYITDVRSSVPAIFEHNPFVAQLNEKDSAVTVIDMEYPQIHRSNTHPVRFATAFTAFLAEKLSIEIQPTEFQIGRAHV